MHPDKLVKEAAEGDQSDHPKITALIPVLEEDNLMLSSILKKSELPRFLVGFFGLKILFCRSIGEHLFLGT